MTGNNKTYTITAPEKDIHLLIKMGLFTEYTTVASTPEVGTLAEIGAQVGDVVEWHGKDGGFVNGRQYKISSIDRNGWFNIGGFTTSVKTGPFRIITRAKPQGPVITETVKRIVPGVYGKVRVYDDNFGLGRCVNMDATWSRADLIAARDVFNQLIDAMPVSS